MPTCTKCKTLLDKNEFYGRSRVCKTCRKAYQREWAFENKDRLARYRADFVEKNPGYYTQKRKEWAEKNPEKAKELEKRKYERKREKLGLKPREQGSKLTLKERQARYYERHPIKAEARKIYRYALRHGKLVKGSCEICGSLEVDGHHEDYTRPLDVRWLCKVHHLEAHEQLRALSE